MTPQGFKPVRTGSISPGLGTTTTTTTITTTGNAQQQRRPSFTGRSISPTRRPMVGTSISRTPSPPGGRRTSFSQRPPSPERREIPSDPQAPCTVVNASAKTQESPFVTSPGSVAPQVPVVPRRRSLGTRITTITVAAPSSFASMAPSSYAPSVGGFTSGNGGGAISRAPTVSLSPPRGRILSLPSSAPVSTGPIPRLPVMIADASGAQTTTTTFSSSGGYPVSPMTIPMTVPVYPTQPPAGGGSSSVIVPVPVAVSGGMQQQQQSFSSPAVSSGGYLPMPAQGGYQRSVAMTAPSLSMYNSYGSVQGGSMVSPPTTAPTRL